MIQKRTGYHSLGGIKTGKYVSNNAVFKKIADYSSTYSVCYVSDIDKVLIRMMHPDKPRIYIEV